MKIVGAAVESRGDEARTQAVPEKTAASQPAASARFLMIAATERSVSLSGVTEPRFLSLWFTEGLDTVDLRDARDLLNELGAMRELGISGSRAAE
jgi:hypothetical protein